jgi:SRSO17 transposase
MKTKDDATAAVASIGDAAECGKLADALVRRVLGRVMRQARSVATALDYVLALSRDVRANAWEVAEKAGHEGPYRMQALLGRYKWSWQDLREQLAPLAAGCLPDDPGDLIGPGLAIDETAHLRKGDAAACVAPQHAGVTGKVENCVSWVFTALVTACAQAWADFDVYMPKSWAGDPGRRQKAGIPEELAFATKPDLAIEQVRRVMASGIRVLWAAADEVYGRCGDFRAALRAARLAYVVIVPCSQVITLAKDKAARADQAFSGAVFERRSAGNGQKGPRYSDWALVATADPREFLLVRRLPARGKHQYTFYLCWAPQGRPATMTYFVTIAGRRWPVETTFRSGKDALGWDQSQARTFTAQCRHTALTALAQIRAAAVRSALAAAIALPATADEARPVAPATPASEPDSADLRIYTGDAPLPVTAGLPCPPGIPPVRLSDAETVRIDRLARDHKAGILSIARLAFHLRWSTWRRRHQARARWHHYTARLAALAA